MLIQFSLQMYSRVSAAVPVKAVRRITSCANYYESQEVCFEDPPEALVEAFRKVSQVQTFTLSDSIAALSSMTEALMAVEELLEGFVGVSEGIPGFEGSTNGLGLRALRKGLQGSLEDLVEASKHSNLLGASEPGVQDYSSAYDVNFNWKVLEDE